MAKENEVYVFGSASSKDELPPDLDESQLDNRKDHYVSDLEVFWTSIYSYIGHLPEEEIQQKQEQFCHCFRSILKAYEDKLFEIKGLQNKLKIVKKENGQQKEEIKKLRKYVQKLHDELSSKTCDDCGKVRISKLEDELEKLSVTDGPPLKKPQEHRERLQKRPRENDEDSSDEDLHRVFTCEHASCGHVALLHLLDKSNIQFCPSKFMRKLGRTTEETKCSKILSSLFRDGLLEIIHKQFGIDDGEHYDAIKNAKEQFIKSMRLAGVLLYSTESDEHENHCVNLYRVEGCAKIRDRTKNQIYVNGIVHARKLQVVVLAYDEEGMPLLKKEWGDCHTRNCEREMKSIRRRKKKPNTSPEQQDVEMNDNVLQDRATSDNTPEQGGNGSNFLHDLGPGSSDRVKKEESRDIPETTSLENYDLQERGKDALLPEATRNSEDLQEHFDMNEVDSHQESNTPQEIRNEPMMEEETAGENKNDDESEPGLEL
ncbi:uncharacterized protein LOC124459031 [Xenia sp. Carnegie-2017]|uniref:uncharacterized protein LOC124459031 n=1 Tax=Xenia sp. Carnegie-2017 TaxID=2897299 RepID=UPI001F04069D|nr:uncharacterized protein LOC124459031 [Xenia sp. Carnegie-2017]XP_046864566.1 uncharacterized protein LOC124459031 [Xenia sp. Carnegie-2017]